MKIGRYEICGLLGRGGMGKVYKVKIPVIAKIAALKLLDPNLLLTETPRAENFCMEPIFDQTQKWLWS